MAYWDCRLEGGPADGDKGRCNDLPPKLYVEWCECPSCEGDWSWSQEPFTGAEVYVLDEHCRMSNMAKFVWANMDTRDLVTYELETADEAAALALYDWAMR